MVVVYTVTASEREAEHLATLALEARLCACANLVPGMRSLYRWEGKLERTEECILLLKTEARHYDALETLIRENHSYQTPAIFMLSVDRVWPGYETWLKNELK